MSALAPALTARQATRRLGHDALQRYLRGGYRDVQGWLSPLAAKAIVSIDGMQKAMGVHGGMCEIGVHDGRSFILLNLLSRADERSIAYDLFERQNENVDASGHGTPATFMANCFAHGCDITRIGAITANSLELTVAAIKATRASPFRLFSVDGGHTARHTENDLALALDTLAAGGVILLDDVFNEQWPGVVEGLLNFLSSRHDALRPFAAIGNKVFFTLSNAWADRYLAHLKADPNTHGPERKMSSFLGRALFVSWQSDMSLSQRLVFQLSRSRHAERLCGSMLWRALGPVVRRTYRS